MSSRVQKLRAVVASPRGAAWASPRQSKGNEAEGLRGLGPLATNAKAWPLSSLNEGLSNENEAEVGKCTQALATGAEGPRRAGDQAKGLPFLRKVLTASRV